ncbi:MAG: cysteine desulfurase [Rhodospirillum sp.]|nr:cysteine desulfurase [Rhodospirillum sp.]MCF8490609.1 cysteine desulfurase [Rhodospirillum sp.]MCF8498944.1 cysteine desulfurase [Rhodospirillum sp.]
MAYLDHNASSPIRPAVAEAVGEALRLHGNPSSIHQDGRRCRAALEDAREAVAALVGARAERVILTSGGTEANALGLLGPGGLESDGRRRVIVGATEHPCVLKADPKAVTIAVDGDGRIDLGHLERLLAAETAPATVGVMLANNETGVIQPLAAVAALCRCHGAWFHCDAVQGPGRLDVSLERIGCDSLALSGHKLGAPSGVGALVLAPGREVAPILRGGGQERGRRAGTENVIGSIGFGAACAQAGEAWRDEAARSGALRDRLEAALRGRFPSLVIHGGGVERLPNTTCLGLPGLEAQRVLMTLDLKGVRVGAGSACSSGSLAPSPVLLAMGLGETAAREAIRVSLGWSTTEADLDLFLEAYGTLAARVMA